MRNTTVMRTLLATIPARLLSSLLLAFTSAIASAARMVLGRTMQAELNDSNFGASHTRDGVFLSNCGASASGAGQARNGVEQWLNQFGTARTIIDVDNNLSQKSSFLDLLVPLYDFADLSAFAYGGGTCLKSPTTLSVRQTAMTSLATADCRHCLSPALNSAR